LNIARKCIKNNLNNKTN